MRRTWSFSDLEFMVLWQDRYHEFLPPPLLFTGRAKLRSEHLRLMAEAREGLRDLDPDVPDLLNAVRTADIRIEVRGWDGRDPLTPEARIRVLGARRGDIGYLVTQHPGETHLLSSGFTVAEFPAQELAEEVVAALPDTEAGRSRDIVLTQRENVEEVDYSFDLSPAHERYEGTVVDRAAEFLAAPAASVGSIEVIQGHSVFGPRGITHHEVEWRDLVDDGRYLVLDENPPLAVAADRRRMIAAIDSRIAEVIFALDDERV
ncbi:ESX secretion-associated protein EspG [Nocardia sp. NPDC050406]|uniref:ESX secretion-associated protein EspG n=1 Tax=Nocardia sp. NPDC050406 TaxID=3364318 RepID=UPI0037AA8C63